MQRLWNVTAVLLVLILTGCAAAPATRDAPPTQEQLAQMQRVATALPSRTPPPPATATPDVPPVRQTAAAVATEAARAATLAAVERDVQREPTTIATPTEPATQPPASIATSQQVGSTVLPPAAVTVEAEATGEPLPVTVAPIAVPTAEPEPTAVPPVVVEPSPTAFMDPNITGRVPDVSGYAAPSDPAWIEVGAIGLSAPLVAVGLDALGYPIVPDHDAAWYSLSARPGQGDNVVLWGHVLRFQAAPNRPAPFERIAELGLGSVITVYTSDGQPHPYEVSQQLWALPEDVYHILPQGYERLTLVSCIGDTVINNGGVVDMSHRLITIATPLQ